MNTVYLLLGGNMGDRERHLLNARDHLKKLGCIIKKSSEIYETGAWGKTDEPAFLNQVLEISTILNADAIMLDLIVIEEKMGRIRTYKNASRIIDIDILFFNEDIISTHDLTIPHPEIANRKFVLVPLAEIAPDLIHPVLLKTSKKLLTECTDRLTVNLFHSTTPTHNL